MGKQENYGHVREVAMNVNVRRIVHSIILILGIVLMVGGIVTGKHGATVIGLIVAAASVQQYLSWKKGNPEEQRGRTP